MERYTFLKNQHDDLVEAAQTLQGIITELDTAMRKQFEEKFKEIGKEFDKVFKELFGGGTGSLELIDDEGDDEAVDEVEVVDDDEVADLINLLKIIAQIEISRQV